MNNLLFSKMNAPLLNNYWKEHSILLNSVFRNYILNLDLLGISSIKKEDI